MAAGLSESTAADNLWHSNVSKLPDDIQPIFKSIECKPELRNSVRFKFDNNWGTNEFHPKSANPLVYYRRNGIGFQLMRNHPQYTPQALELFRQSLLTNPVDITSEFHFDRSFTAYEPEIHNPGELGFDFPALITHKWVEKWLETTKTKLEDWANTAKLNCNNKLLEGDAATDLCKTKKQPKSLRTPLLNVMSYSCCICNNDDSRRYESPFKARPCGPLAILCQTTDKRKAVDCSHISCFVDHMIECFVEKLGVIDEIRCPNKECESIIPLNITKNNMYLQEMVNALKGSIGVCVRKCKRLMWTFEGDGHSCDINVDRHLDDYPGYPDSVAIFPNGVVYWYTFLNSECRQQLTQNGHFISKRIPNAGHIDKIKLQSMPKCVEYPLPRKDLKVPDEIEMYRSISEYSGIQAVLAKNMALEKELKELKRRYSIDGQTAGPSAAADVDMEDMSQQFTQQSIERNESSSDESDDPNDPNYRPNGDDD